MNVNVTVFRARHPILDGIALGLLMGVIFGVLLWLSGGKPLGALVGGAVFAGVMAPFQASQARKALVDFPAGATPETVVAVRRLIRRGDPVEDISLAPTVVEYAQARGRIAFRPREHVLASVLCLIIAITLLVLWGIRDGDTGLIVPLAAAVTGAGLYLCVGIPYTARLRRRMAAAERQALDLIAAHG
jgi:hypothetical protein